MTYEVSNSWMKIVIPHPVTCDLLALFASMDEVMLTHQRIFRDR